MPAPALIAGLLVLAAATPAPAATAPTTVWPTSHGRNYEESKVGEHPLPDPLRARNGTPVTNPDTWRNTRRGEILQDFRDLMYGHTPDLPAKTSARLTATQTNAVNGLATRSLVRLSFFDDPAAPTVELALYLPNAARGPVPVFLGLNYYGNASVEADPAIPLSGGWMRPVAEMGIVNHRATAQTRGVHASRWPLARILERGYGVATFYYGDIEPDHLEGWRDGIRGYALRQAGRTARPADGWGALGAWAWGLSRALDYLVTHPQIDPRRIAVIGHSRHGKAALWAGAQDERFALVIANNSGEGGAALARRNFGENIAYSLAHASWRYCDRFREFVDRAPALPFDQHFLVALLAPRPVYIASATNDLGADPKGEFLSGVHAEPVYRLFGRTGLGTRSWPPPDVAVGGTIGYHRRTGDHDITAWDWEQYLTFADRHLPPGETSSNRPARPAGAPLAR